MEWPASMRVNQSIVHNYNGSKAGDVCPSSGYNCVGSRRKRSAEEIQQERRRSGLNSRFSKKVRRRFCQVVNITNKDNEAKTKDANRNTNTNTNTNTIRSRNRRGDRPCKLSVSTDKARQSLATQTVLGDHSIQNEERREAKGTSKFIQLLAGHRATEIHISQSLNLRRCSRPAKEKEKKETNGTLIHFQLLSCTDFPFLSVLCRSY